MIADELRARIRYPNLRLMLDQAEWVELPFPVFPFIPEEGCLDWKSDRVPLSLIPTDGQNMVTTDRLPFPILGLFTPREAGCLLVSERRAATAQDVQTLIQEILTRTGRLGLDDTPWDLNRVDGAILAYLIGLERSVIVQGFLYFIIRSDPKAPREDPHATRVLWPFYGPLMDQDIEPQVLEFGLKTIHLHNTVATLQANGYQAPDPTTLRREPAWWAHVLRRRGPTLTSLRDQWWLDTKHQVVTISTAVALLNAKNLTRRRVEPRHERAARRRGDPPPYRYHVLTLDPRRARHTGVHGEADEPESHVALHLKRGHWKTYTPEAPLLGKHVGRWWWAPHLAGQADGIVDKDYKIKEES